MSLIRTHYDYLTGKKKKRMDGPERWGLRPLKKYRDAEQDRSTNDQTRSKAMSTSGKLKNEEREVACERPQWRMGGA